MTTYIAKTFHGLEGVLAEELKAMGAENVRTLSRAVSFDGDEALCYRANISCRTALRILVPVAEDMASDQHQLYHLAKSVNWLRWFTPDKTIAVFATVAKAPQFRNTAFVAMKIKDGIADQFRTHYAKRPSVDKDNPDVRIHAHIFQNKCYLYIDSTGESLHRRAYRKGGHRAPLNEVLAAGMVLLSGWDKEQPLIDPMCGSGTILTEAALLAKNISPNINRTVFACHHWKNFDEKLWDKVWLEERAKERKFEGVIIGSDIDSKAIQEARANVIAAKVDDCVRLSVKAFEDREVKDEGGMIICNPPYGERLRPRDVEQLYSTIGDELKQKYQGFTAWIISSNIAATKKVGLRPSKKMRLYNGALECVYLKYEMYKGTRRKFD